MPRRKKTYAEKQAKEYEKYNYQVLNINFEVGNILARIENDLEPVINRASNLSPWSTRRKASDIKFMYAQHIPDLIKNTDKFLKKCKPFVDKGYISQSKVNKLKAQKTKLIAHHKDSFKNKKITDQKKMIKHIIEKLKPIVETIENILGPDSTPSPSPQRSRSRSRSRSKSPSKKTVRAKVGGGKRKKKRNKTKKRRKKK